jgi:hypothetical protein
MPKDRKQQLTGGSGSRILTKRHRRRRVKDNQMANDLAKLNRLRENAGKNPLKTFKAGQEKLDAAIKTLEEAGYTDVLPGANTEIPAQTDDPEVKAARPPEDESKVINGKPSLARGLDKEQYAAHSRKAVRDHREKEKKEKALLSPEDKKQIADEAKLRKGEVDAKKDPKKAARQKKHIEDKKAARKAAGKVSKIREKNPDEITVADIARELDIDPKVARAKLRRHEDKIKSLHTKGQDRWTFPKSAKAKIMAILK